MKKILSLTFMAMLCVAALLSLSACGECEHSWGAWSVTKQATCEIAGEETRVCKECEEKDTRILSAKGHNYDTQNASWNWNGYNGVTVTLTCRTDPSHTQNFSATVTSELITAPTCQKAGNKLHTATVQWNDITLTNTKTEVLSKVAHSFGNGVITQFPTATEPGIMTYSCQNCSATKTEAIDPTGEIPEHTHTWGEWEVIGSQTVRECTDPSCSESQRATAIRATYNGASLTVGDSVQKSDISVTITIDNSTTEAVSDFTLENAVMQNAGTNSVTVRFMTLSTSVSVTAVLQENATPATDFLYEIYDNEITITGYTGSSTEIVIPSYITVDGVNLPVVHIGENAFQNCTTIVSLTTLRNMESIGTGAFSGCSGLRELTLNEGLKTIHGKAFYGCPITELVIPNSVTTFEPYYHSGYHGAFEECRRLETVVIGDGLTSIPVETFKNCVSLKSVTIGDFVSSIGESAFSGCSSLTNITIGTGVQTIGVNAFSNSGLQSVTISPSVRTIEESAFENCISLTSVNIPSGVQTIGTGAFSGCSGLRELALNEGLKTIYGKAFYGCPITELVIPNSVTTFEPYYHSGYHGAFEECRRLETVVIGDGLTNIPVETFKNCVSLKSVTIGDFVSSIGESAFSGCSSLTNITIGTGVQTIGVNAFSNSGLQSVTISPSVRTIEESAFENCISLTSVNIPSGVQTIGVGAFSGCSGLRELTLNEGLKTIYGKAFYGCPISALIIPNSVTTFEPYYHSGYHGAFEECRRLETVVIGDGLTSIPVETFKNCISLKSVTIGDFVSSIGDSAFSGCSALEYIYIPANVTTIAGSAFSNCDKLQIEHETTE